MPSPTTALQLIEGALALTNSVGADQTLTAQEVTIGLSVFNDLLESLSLDGLSVPGEANQSFLTIADQKEYTIGPAMADWTAERPIAIMEPAYATIQNVTFPYANLTQQQYNLIGYKEQPGGGTDSPQFYMYVNSFPLGRVTLWPVPNAEFEITFSINYIFSSVSTAGATLTFAPGYANMFKYNLAVMLAPYFGKKMANYPEIVALAKKSLGDIKRANNTPAVLQFDPATLGVGYYNYYNWS